jgi:hypothetical protein
MRNLRMTVIVLFLLVMGCGRSQPSLAHVQGRVFYRGEPLAGGTIVFTPDADRGGQGPMAWAQIEADGHYRLSTDGRYGASPGWHRITIAAASSEKLPARYRDPDLSGQRFEVRTDRPNRCDLNLD